MAIGADQIKALAQRGTRDLRLLAFTIFCVSFGFGSYFSTFNNFAVEALNLQPSQLGILESLREVPGFLMFLVAALTMRVAEPILATIALGLLAVGLGAYYAVDSVPTLLLYSLVWSIGLHAWMPLSPSMALSLADERSKGRRLGQLGAVGAFGTICGMVLVFLGGKYIGYRNIFVLAGVIVAAGAVSVSMIRRDIGQKEKPRMVFKRRYSLYYALVFLEGCRKQVFITFAIFALVRNYHTPLQIVAGLMIANNLMNIFLAPKVGRLIDRIGERKVLAFCYAALIPVFLGYAFIKHPPILYSLYFLDNLFFLGSIGLTTYLHKIAEPEDVMPSLAMGVSVNHLAAVIVPITGGFLWAKLGYQIPFYGGAIVVAISVLTVLRMKIHRPAEVLEAVAAGGE
jgi:predicted MFS family arabinose efflux permease